MLNMLLELIEKTFVAMLITSHIISAHTQSQAFLKTVPTIRIFIGHTSSCNPLLMNVSWRIFYQMTRWVTSFLMTKADQKAALTVHTANL